MKKGSWQHIYGVKIWLSDGESDSGSSDSENYERADLDAMDDFMLKGDCPDDDDGDDGGSGKTHSAILYLWSYYYIINKTNVYSRIMWGGRPGNTSCWNLRNGLLRRHEWIRHTVENVFNGFLLPDSWSSLQLGFLFFNINKALQALEILQAWKIMGAMIMKP